MTKQIPINLWSGVAGTVRADDRCAPYNMIDCPRKYRFTAIAEILPPASAGRYVTAHYAKIAPRNILSGFHEPAVMTIRDGKQSHSDSQSR